MKRLLALFALTLLLAAGASSQYFYRYLQIGDTLYIGPTIGNALGLYQYGDSLWAVKGSVGPINLFRPWASGTAEYFGLFNSANQLGNGGLWRFGQSVSRSLKFEGGTGSAKFVLANVHGDTGYISVSENYDASTMHIGPNLYVDGVLTGNGSGLTALNATNIASGILSANRFPSSGVAQGTYYAPDLTVDGWGRVTWAQSGRSTLMKGVGSAGFLSYWIDPDSLGYSPKWLVSGNNLVGNARNGDTRIVFRDAEGGSDSASIKMASNLKLVFYDPVVNEDVTLTEILNRRDNLTVSMDSADIANINTRSLLKWNLPRDFVVDTMFAAVQGTTGDTIAMDFGWSNTHYNDPGGETHLQSTPSNIPASTNGTTVTSFSNTTIYRNYWVWMRLTKKTGTPKNCIFVLRGRYTGAL